MAAKRFIAEREGERQRSKLQKAVENLATLLLAKIWQHCYKNVYPTEAELANRLG